MEKRNILLTPGPTPIPPRVLEALARPIIHHRTEEYRVIFKEVSEGLKEVFRTKNEVYTFTSSGTGAMESSIVNFLSPGDPVLVLAAGKFGERFTEIAQAYKLAVDTLRVPNGEACDPKKVERELEKESYKAVFATLTETSTGIVNDIQALGEVVAKTDAFFAVDAISGLATDRLETDAWKVDLAISGSQKGLMLPPGLAFLSVSEKAKCFIPHAKIARYYLDFALYEKALKDQDSPFTPAINIVIGMQEALKIIKERGMEGMWKESERLALLTRRAVQALGMELFAKRPSNGVTAVKAPAGLDVSKMLKVLQNEYGVVMAGGQDEMKGKIFRLAHMGYITQEDLAAGFECLEDLLQKMGYKFNKGASVKIFRSEVRV